MQESKETIVSHAYDLLKTAIPLLNTFPRNYKFTLGDRIQNHLTELLEALIEALYLPAAEKKPLLQKINIRLEKIRYLFRLGFELGLYTSLKYNEFARRIDTIGRMLGGWIKALK